MASVPTTTHAYDAAGNRVATTDALGHTTTLGYDASGSLTSRTSAGATPDVTYAYDPAGNRTSMTDGQAPRPAPTTMPGAWGP